MRFPAKALCFLCALYVLCGASFALDREAFSITNYNLYLQIEPEQHRLGVRGKITLRNDRDAPQKMAVLQISSSLGWRSIKAGDRAVQFVTQPFTSDIDHTGQLSEAIVTLPQEVAPHASVDLDIAYEGVILLDATRLTRIGTPEDLAKSTDWDQIDTSFTAVRGAGYVAWYPIATESANLSENNDLPQVLTRWKVREAGSVMHLRLAVSWKQIDSPLPHTFFSGLPCTMEPYLLGVVDADCLPQKERLTSPSLLIADYLVQEKLGVEMHFLPAHGAAAARFAEEAEKVAPLIHDWFGSQRERAKVADLPDPDAAPFESGALLLTPLSNLSSNSAGLAAAHQLTHVSFLSFRPWIDEGLAHFAQVLYLEQQKGRQAALVYMGAHRSVLTAFESSAGTPRSDEEVTHSLVNTVNEELYRSKAMCVWWMLRDVIGDAALKKAIASYKPEQDNDPTYMPRLIAAQTQRDLSWFFDDWVYRDHGLPDFKVESAFSSRTLTKSFLVAITVDNLGSAGAEVPVKVKFAGGEVTKRLEIRAKQKATIRIETPAAAQEIVVNDGSVPESDTTNNTLKVDAPSN